MDTNRLIHNVLFFILFATNLYSQHVTKVTIKPNIYDKKLQITIHDNLTKLLNEFNLKYYDQQSSFAYNKIHTTGAGKKAIEDFIYDYGYYECSETNIVVSLVEPMRQKIYEVRGVQVRTKSKELESLVISFDLRGRIIDFGFEEFTYEYKNFLKTDYNNQSNIPQEYRNDLLDIILKFKKAYNYKDINAISNYFSDDASIITGTEIKIPSFENPDNPLAKTFVRSTSGKIYRMVRQSKSDYIKNLQRLFKRVSSLQVQFNDIKIARHYKMDNVFCVLLQQDWITSTYKDKGYLYLTISFENTPPKVHARRWVPKEDFNASETSSTSEDLLEALTKE